MSSRPRAPEFSTEEITLILEAALHAKNNEERPNLDDTAEILNSEYHKGESVRDRAGLRIKLKNLRAYYVKHRSNDEKMSSLGYGELLEKVYADEVGDAPATPAKSSAKADGKSPSKAKKPSFEGPKSPAARAKRAKDQAAEEALPPPALEAAENSGDDSSKKRKRGSRKGKAAAESVTAPSPPAALPEIVAEALESAKSTPAKSKTPKKSASKKAKTTDAGNASASTSSSIAASTSLGSVAPTVFQVVEKGVHVEERTWNMPSQLWVDMIAAMNNLADALRSGNK